jgi:putative ABC transport system permease protein
MYGLVQSLRYTLRVLLKSPGFTVTAVLILGFGIGANTAIFSLIDSVLLRPLPYGEPEKMVAIYMPSESAPDRVLDYPDYLDYAAMQHTLTALGLSVWDSFDLVENGSAERIKGTYATASAFQVFGVPFVLGRPFTADEDKPGGPLVAVLAEHFWRIHFSGDPNIVGTSIDLNGHTFQVIGVVKPIDSEYSDAPKVFVPLNAVDVVGDWDKWRGRDSHFLFCLGRLKNGVTLAQAQADLETIQRNLAARYPEDMGYGVRLEGDQYATMKDYSGTLWLLFGAAGALLLISTTNVSTLLMARASDRQHEMTIRSAMGASRLRLIGYLLRDSALLSFIGGLLGIPVALTGIQFIKWLGPEDMPRVFDVSLNPEALFMFFVVSLFAAVASGLFPALLLSKTHPESALRAGGSRGATAGPQHRRMQSIMTICQVSIACVLLVGTGLLVRSFQAAVSIPLGFNPRHLLTAEIYLVNKKYRDQWAADSFFDAFLDKVRQVPDVTAAAVSDNPPFSREQSNNTPFTIPGQPAPETGHEPRLEDQLVSSTYFKTLQTPLVAGRDFNETDQRSNGQRFINAVVIVNQALADTFFPGQSSLGRQIELPGSWMAEKTYTIVGVVQNMRHGVPDHHFSKFEAYFPYCQHLTHFETLLVRSSSDPMALLPALRQAIASIDPDIPLVKVISFDDVLAKRFATRRLAAMLVSIFSVTALLLAAVGLYGVLAYTVTRQTREIGIRIAVGALRRNILTLVFKQGFKIVGIGIVAGLLAGSALNGILGNLLYGVGWNDPITITLSVAAICFAALIACLLPALRATRINPIAALRE